MWRSARQGRVATLAKSAEEMDTNVFTAMQERKYAKGYIPCAACKKYNDHKRMIQSKAHHRAPSEKELEIGWSRDVPVYLKVCASCCHTQVCKLLADPRRADLVKEDFKQEPTLREICFMISQIEAGGIIPL